MIRALRTGNYSVVIGWLADELTAEEHERLVIAAQEGHAMGLSCGRLEIRTRWETTQRAKNSLKFVSLSEIRINPGIFLLTQYFLTGFFAECLSDAVSRLFW
jgi:hypothetical protein